MDKATSPTFTLTVGDVDIRLYINGALHLLIRTDQLVGIQSWELGGVHYIEYATKTKSILTEYDTREKWLAILGLIDKQDLFKPYSRD